ncbi:unnamed protein product [Protopolystoma xenopodis]|uniref:Uncharacterized protein n=1 Tax=Protopolystoma xenopodis TaxID=117903 RepID=A0A448X6A9_9PLAT|nr:unnamed protein product [Protopolystoma xenopodis]
MDPWVYRHDSRKKSPTRDSSFVQTGSTESVWEIRPGSCILGTHSPVTRIRVSEASVIAQPDGQLDQLKESSGSY